MANFVTQYTNDPFNALEAKTEAQKLSFAPIVLDRKSVV